MDARVKPGHDGREADREQEEVAEEATRSHLSCASIGFTFQTGSEMSFAAVLR
jgi:hypothetical protein